MAGSSAGASVKIGESGIVKGSHRIAVLGLSGLVQGVLIMARFGRGATLNHFSRVVADTGCGPPLGKLSSCALSNLGKYHAFGVHISTVAARDYGSVELHRLASKHDCSPCLLGLPMWASLGSLAPPPAPPPRLLWPQDPLQIP